MPDIIVSHWTGGVPDAYSLKEAQLLPSAILMAINFCCLGLYGYGLHVNKVRVRWIAVGSIFLLDIVLAVADVVNVL